MNKTNTSNKGQNDQDFARLRARGRHPRLLLAAVTAAHRAGHPLYTFAGDTSPGATNGQCPDAERTPWRTLM